MRGAAQAQVAQDLAKFRAQGKSVGKALNKIEKERWKGHDQQLRLEQSQLEEGPKRVHPYGMARSRVGWCSSTLGMIVARRERQ